MQNNHELMGRVDIMVSGGSSGMERALGWGLVGKEVILCFICLHFGNGNA